MGHSWGSYDPPAANRPFEHTVTIGLVPEGSVAHIRVDGRRKKIRLSADRKWVHIGCTTIELKALDRLYAMVHSYEVLPQEIVLQEE